MVKVRIRAHSGEVLRKEFLTPLGMSATALAEEIDVPANRISDLIRERGGMTAERSVEGMRREAMVTKPTGGPCRKLAVQSRLFGA